MLIIFWDISNILSIENYGKGYIWMVQIGMKFNQTAWQVKWTGLCGTFMISNSDTWFNGWSTFPLTNPLQGSCWDFSRSTNVNFSLISFLEFASGGEGDHYPKILSDRDQIFQIIPYLQWQVMKNADAAIKYSRLLSECLLWEEFSLFSNRQNLTEALKIIHVAL